jgi:hypothetical protein
MSTATEIQLRMEAGARQMAATCRGFDRLLNQYLVLPVMFRLLWRVEMQEAMRATAFQLTYSPKD